MSDVAAIIVVDNETDFSTVKAACERHGLKSISALPQLRILKGLIDEDGMAALAKIAGVRSVEKERDIKLPPHGSPVQ